MTLEPSTTDANSSGNQDDPRFVLLVWVLVVFVCALGLLIVYADRVGWEGDDLAQIEGCVNFDHKGPAEVYRFYWQPLTYELGRLALTVVDDPTVLFVLPQIFGAACIAVLVLVVHGYSRGRIPVLVSVAFVLLLPEIVLSGLYYNSTVFGLLPLLVALLLVVWPIPAEGAEDGSRSVRSVAAGAAGAAACLFRFDFLLCQPLLLYLVVTNWRRDARRGALSYIAGFGVVLLLAMSAGLFDFGELVEVKRLHSEHVSTWGVAEPSAVAVKAFTITNLVVWLVLFARSVTWVASIVAERRWTSFGVVIPAAVVLYPLSGLTSPKYLLPAVAFVPLVLAGVGIDVRQRYGSGTFRLWSLAAITLGVAVQLVSFEPRRSFPFVAVTTDPTFVSTADGPRALGAYMKGYELFCSPPDGRPSTLRFSFALARAVTCIETDVDVLYLEHPKNWTSDNWRWAWPSLHLQRQGYSVSTYDLNREIVLVSPKHSVRLRRVGVKEYGRPPHPGSRPVVEVPFVAYDDPHRTRKLLHATEVLDLTACAP